MAFAYVQDQERVYHSVREKLLYHSMTMPSSYQFTFMQLNLHLIAPTVLRTLE